MISYDGDYNENNAPHGIGVMTYKNGNIYEGTFENGKRNGYGKLITKRCQKIGLWKDDKPDGIQKEIKNNGTEIVATFKEGKKGGIETKKDPNSSTALVTKSSGGFS